MIILGIETSCDETSAAVVVDGRDVRSNVVSSQVDLHARYGGVVPEIAARAHIERIDDVIAAALEDSGTSLDDMDAIAVTEGPGLIGALLVGLTAAKTISALSGKPLVAVDHLHAHVTSASITLDHDPFPAIALVVSGGHTSIYHVQDPLEPQLIGQTRDDAVGEAFDKVAAVLDLGYPGGPIIDKTARDGDPKAINFPISRIDDRPLDFSYSGLKTAVMYHVFGHGEKYGSASKLSATQLADITASFQRAAVKPLVDRTLRAVEQTGVRRVLVGGGVAANSALREMLTERCTAEDVTLHLTPMRYCTDNAAMIAAHADRLARADRFAELDLTPRAGLRRPRGAKSKSS